jgi:hypothetical protein
MGAPGVQKAERAARPEPKRCFASAAEMKEVLERLLKEIDEDPTVGPQLRSIRVSQRYVFPDIGVVLNIAPAESDSDHCLRWSFDDDVEWKPALTLEMDSDVANRYLQGRENLAIAIARRRIRASANARAALTYLPVSQGLIDRYKAIVERFYPQLLDR